MKSVLTYSFALLLHSQMSTLLNEKKVLEMPDDLFQHQLALSKGTVWWMCNKRAQCPQVVREVKGKPCVVIHEVRRQRLGVHSQS